MAKVIEARAFCNNEVAYLAWKTDGKIKDCLGFMITRINLDTGERRLLPTWVAFNTQSNPHWEEQDTICRNRVPSPCWVSSLYMKRGDRWLNAFYQQTQIQN